VKYKKLSNLTQFIMLLKHLAMSVILSRYIICGLAVFDFRSL